MMQVDARDGVPQSAASRLAKGQQRKRPFRINGNAVLTGPGSDSEFDAVLQYILRFGETSRGNAAFYSDEIADVSMENPVPTRIGLLKLFYSRMI